MNILWSILWIILLLFIVWWIAGLAAWLYILIVPFAACIPLLKPLTDFLLKVVTFPYEVGTYIRDGKRGC
jgi:hypothetical protein